MNPTWATRAEAIRSLREFAPWLRKKHRVIKYWSTKYQAYRWCRQFSTAHSGRVKCST